MHDAVPVAEAIGTDLAAHGVCDLFALLGSGNFVIGHAFAAANGQLVSARQETAAVAMADAYARASGEPGVCTVHHGPGLTNAITGLAEAAKSRTPLLLVTADTPADDRYGNFAVDQAALAAAIGVGHVRASAPGEARALLGQALARVRAGSGPVIFAVPTDVQAAPAGPPAGVPSPATAPLAAPDAEVARAASAIADAERVVVLAGRGALRSGAQGALLELAETTDAWLGTTAAAVGMFRGHPRGLGLVGGFAAPAVRRAVAAADVIVAVGASLNGWTTHHGMLVAGGATIVQIDHDPAAFGRHMQPSHALLGDAALTVSALDARLAAHARREVAPRALLGGWSAEPFVDTTGGGRIDPRRLCLELDQLVPTERTVVIDSGQFMAFPAMYLTAPDPAGFVFSQGFMSVGLGLAGAIGAAVARPDRPVVLAIGDGGLLMALGELETLARLAVPVLVVVFNDAAYGAEVHDFGAHGYATDLVRFPETDFAAVARSVGIRGINVASTGDLAPVQAWGREPGGPLLVDARIDPDIVAAAWL